MRSTLTAVALLVTCLAARPEAAAAEILYNWVVTTPDPGIPRLDMTIELPDAFWFGMSIDQEAGGVEPFLKSDSQVLDFTHLGGAYGGFSLDRNWAPCGDLVVDVAECAAMDPGTLVKYPYTGFGWHLRREGRGIAGSIGFHHEETSVTLESLPGSDVWQLSLYAEAGMSAYCYNDNTSSRVCKLQGIWVPVPSTIPVPEPTPLTIAGVGLLGVYFARRQRAG